jgi:hypothetical protein
MPRQLAVPACGTNGETLSKEGLSHLHQDIEMNKKLGEVARQANNYVARWIEKHPAVKEESLTDWLPDFLEQNSPNVQYYELDQHEEKCSSGFDWDWWFLLEYGCFRARVKAKKLQLLKDYYSELTQSIQTGCQIDLLLDSSAAKQFYPLYLFYAKPDDVERCRVLPTPTALSICGAQEIHKLAFGTPCHHIECRDICAVTFPLECLFYCPVTRDFPPNGPEQPLLHYFQTPLRGCLGDMEAPGDDRHRGYAKSVPRIIRSLFKMREGNSNTERILRDYQSMFEGSRGVVIFDME